MHQLYLFVSGAALRLGWGLAPVLGGIGLVLLGIYYVLCCYAIPRRLTTVLASSLYLSALVILYPASVLLVLRLVGWAP